MHTKKILLFGDSIRQGYDHYVKTALNGICNVYYSKDNSQFAHFLLRHLHEWAEWSGCGENVDLIHWNVGLWDTLELFDDNVLTPISFYADSIKRICKRIKHLYPNAKVIFATSTYVQEDMFPEPHKMKRRNMNTIEYNKVACEIVKSFGFEINDLYELTSKLDKTYYSDMTHLYTEKGEIVMLQKVLGVICNSLNIDNNFDCEKIVKEHRKNTEVLGM